MSNNEIPNNQMENNSTTSSDGANTHHDTVSPSNGGVESGTLNQANVDEKLLDMDDLDSLYTSVDGVESNKEGFFQEDAKKPAVTLDRSESDKVSIALTYGYSNYDAIVDTFNKLRSDNGDAYAPEELAHMALILDNGNHLYGPNYEERDGRTGADYGYYQSQYVKDPDTFLRNKIPGRKDSKNDIEMINRVKPFERSGTLKGSNAVLAITSALGRTGLFEIPLVNSGIRIALRTPKLEEFVGLEEQLGYNKGQLGRSTLGLIFTHMDVLMTETLYSFIFNYIEKCNVANWRVNGQVNVDLLRQIIKLSDLFTLVNGLLACYYPEGHKLVQPCSNIEDKCLHTEHGKVHFPNMFWVNESMLSESQLAHMTNSLAHEYTIDEVIKYQNSFNYKHSTYVHKLDTNSAIEFEFDTPSLDSYSNAGGSWIQGIESIINANIKNKSDEISKRRLMSKLTRDNELKLYTSWIKSITAITDVSNNIRLKLESYDDIVQLIEYYSEDETFINEVMENVWKFIEYSSTTVIGIPSRPCPACGHSAEPQVKTHPTIIPINVVESFFTLLAPSMSRRINLI